MFFFGEALILSSRMSNNALLFQQHHGDVVVVGFHMAHVAQEINLDVAGIWSIWIVALENGLLVSMGVSN